MQILSSLLFGVSASLDALILGISYGIRKIHIKLWQNLLISLVTLLGTCLAIGFGRWQGVLLQAMLPGVCGSIPLERCIGSMVLVLFGIYYLFQFMRMRTLRMRPLRKNRGKAQASGKPAAQSGELTAQSGKVQACENLTVQSEETQACENLTVQSGEDAPSSQKASVIYAALKDALFLGFALSANNMGIGLGASIAGLAPGSAAVSTFLFSAVFLSLGNCLGKSRLSDWLGQAATPVSGLLLLGLGICEWFW